MDTRKCILYILFDVRRVSEAQGSRGSQPPSVYPLLSTSGTKTGGAHKSADRPWRDLSLPNVSWSATSWSKNQSLFFLSFAVCCQDGETEQRPHWAPNVPAAMLALGHVFYQLILARPISFPSVLTLSTSSAPQSLFFFLSAGVSFSYFHIHFYESPLRCLRFRLVCPCCTTRGG